MSENEEEEIKEEVEEKPQVLGTKIRLAGDKDNCGVCKEGDEFFSQTAGGTDTTSYEYHHLDSDRGREIVDNANYEDNEDGTVPIPLIEYCKDVKDEEGNVEQKCDYIQGFKKNDWDQKLNYKRQNTVDEEIEELFGDSGSGEEAN